VFSLGGSSFYTSTEKSNKNKYNIKKQSGKEADRQTEYTTWKEECHFWVRYFRVCYNSSVGSILLLQR